MQLPASWTQLHGLPSGNSPDRTRSGWDAVQTCSHTHRLAVKQRCVQVNEVVKLAPRARQTILFSATMTDEVQQLAALSLRQPVRLAADEPSTAPVRLAQEVLRLKVSAWGDLGRRMQAGRRLLLLLLQEAFCCALQRHTIIASCASHLSSGHSAISTCV